MTVDSVETLVIHPGALGDVLQAVPALAALGRLGNRLTFAGQPRLGELLKGSGVVLAAAPFDTFGLEALFVDAPVSDRLASRLERFRRVVSWFGAREAGYANRLGALVPEAIVAPPVPDDESPFTVWEHLVDTLTPWGVTLPTELHSLPTTERWRIAARTSLMALEVDESRPLLIAHPGAGARWKRAPTERFAQALERMRRDGGFEVVVHQGPADADAVEALEVALGASSKRLIEPALTELAGALALAHAYIGSDSGVSHLAASVGTPSVILFPPETLRRWAPWGTAALPLGVGSEGEEP
jgi:heptosyltransferase III